MQVPVTKNKMTEPTDQFVMELAANIFPPEEIAARHGYTIEELRKLLNEDWFKARLREARAAWESDANVKERVRVKAALAAESTLLDIVEIIKDSDASAASRIAAHEHLTKLGRLDPKQEVKDDGAQSAPFRIIINMPNSNEPISIEAPKELLTNDEGGDDE